MPVQSLTGKRHEIWDLKLDQSEAKTLVIKDAVSKHGSFTR